MRCVYTGGCGEIEEKKSRFIANTAPVTTEEEASEFIEKIRKQHYNARHNCYAYVLENGIMRSSDDGEPSGTAGRPILEIICGENLTNTLVVVTRYFGGTLLGTGGLLRAYQASAKAGLNNSVIIDKIPAVIFSVKCDYSLIGMLQHIFSEENIHVINSDYSEDVSFSLAIDIDRFSQIKKLLNDKTSARITITKQKECMIAEINGSIQIFE